MLSTRIGAVCLIAWACLGSGAMAQTRPWVDPPAEAPAPPAARQPAETPPLVEPEAEPAPPTAERAPELAPETPPVRQGAREPARAPDPAPETPTTEEALRPERPAPDRTPAVAARPQPASPIEAREKAARDLLLDYLAAWSAPNEEVLAAMPEFYAPTVSFHGKARSARSVLSEKQQFIQRWPSREYTPRTDTMGVTCSPGADTCTVRSVFDFNAFDPRRDRRSRGVATLELVVRFERGDMPMIVSENSIVHGRGGDPTETGTLSNDTP